MPKTKGRSVKKVGYVPQRSADRRETNLSRSVPEELVFIVRMVGDGSVC